MLTQIQFNSIMVYHQMQKKI